jgi:UDP-N-acetylglucosamine--N-acetylmuramyl-(pentapeptide) pyrophosphoryl-undecaprenol N-acetylglucosamine transferase
LEHVPPAQEYSNTTQLLEIMSRGASKIVIAAGGTGGHLFPGLAVGEVLVREGWEVLVLTSEKAIDRVATEGRHEFRIERLPATGMPRLFSPGMVLFFFRLLMALWSCISLYRRFRPDVVLAMGGFTSTAPVVAAWLCGIPAVVHESNVVPGKANRLNARFCARVLIGFEEARARFGALGRDKVEMVGTPVRGTLRKAVDRSSACASFGLDSALPVVLVMGGSQGAQGLNRAIAAALSRIGHGKQRVQFLHLTGPDDEVLMRSLYATEGITAKVMPFCKEMEAAYGASDLVVMRSGAASLTELAWFGLPSLLIPLPSAADDHQTLNARVFEREGAAYLLPQRELTDGVKLANALESVLSEGPVRERMAAKAAALAVRDSAERVAKVVAGLRKNGGASA